MPRESLFWLSSVKCSKMCFLYGQHAVSPLINSSSGSILKFVLTIFVPFKVLRFPLEALVVFTVVFFVFVIVKSDEN